MALFPLTSTSRRRAKPRALAPSKQVYGHTEERSPDTCYETEEPRKHEAQRRQPEQKTTWWKIPLLRDVQNRQIHGGRKQMSGPQGLGWGMRGD